MGSDIISNTMQILGMVGCKELRVKSHGVLRCFI